jgi:hypothetical protein
MSANYFELLELPGGRWCVARFEGSDPGPTGYDPVGFYASRDEAELAILRATAASRSGLTGFSEWLRQS